MNAPTPHEEMPPLPTLDPPPVGGVPGVDGTPTPAMQALAKIAPNMPPRGYESLEPVAAAQRVKITLTRVRQLAASARSMQRAHTALMVNLTEMLAGRHDEDGTVVERLTDARDDIFEGDISTACARIGQLADEFESLHR